MITNSIIHALDDLSPTRTCNWCSHPRNSDECQFGAKHAPYREFFTPGGKVMAEGKGPGISEPLTDKCPLCCKPRAGNGTRYCAEHFKICHGFEYGRPIGFEYGRPIPVDMVNLDMVNHPPHYTRGPFVQLGDNPATTGRDTMNWIKSTVEYGRRVGIEIECIEVIRHITDMRLATAMKYIWRVAFGGKDNDREDIKKAIFYLQDWLDNPL